MPRLLPRRRHGRPCAGPLSNAEASGGLPRAIVPRGVATALVATTLAGAIAALLAGCPIGFALDRELGAWLAIRARGPVEAPLGAVVIAQDHASAAALGLPNRLGGWPRRHLAQVIERAGAAGARIIVVDLFLDASQAEADDAALERAIAASGRVVLVERVSSGEVSRPAALRIVEERIMPPLARFGIGAHATAPLPLPRDGWRVSAFWAFKAGTGGRPTLPAATLLSAVLTDPAARGAIAEAASAEALPDVLAMIVRDDIHFPTRIDRLRQLLAGNPAADRIVARIAASDGGDRAARRLAVAAVRLLIGAESRLLVPYGPAGAVPRVPYHRIAVGDPDALRMLRGQVVFIGASDLRNQAEVDIFRTVFARPDGVEMAGVEIAATAFLNLLLGHDAQPVPPAVAALLAAGSAAGAALLGLALQPALALAAVAAGGAAVSAAAVPMLEAHRVALPLGSMLVIALPLGLIAAWLAQRGLARRQLDRTVDILTRGRVRHVNPLVSLDHAGRRHRRWVVCLASDLGDYVGLTESMLSREPLLADFLARYRGVVHEVVQRHGGTVLDFVGDASMCLWDAERPSAVLRVKAVDAAMELVERLHSFAVTHQLQRHRTRVGLAEGTIVLGNIDDGGHFFFGAVGEPLNIASRLEQLNKQLGTYVLATAAVVQGLDSPFVRRIGPVPLKGMAAPEEVVALDFPCLVALDA